jgi:tRNA-specific 2-thiouridylase
MKTKVKDIACKNSLAEIASKKESMGICFIGKRSFGAFVSDYIEQKPGNLIEYGSNKVLGRFEGLSYYTIGQRAAIGGKKWYVLEKNIANNTISVVDSLEHALFYKQKIKIRLHWISGKPKTKKFEIKYRYQTSPIRGIVFDDGSVLFDGKGGHCLALGQQIAIYDGDICYGGGPITHIW